MEYFLSFVVSDFSNETIVTFIKGQTSMKYLYSLSLLLVGTSEIVLS